MARPGRYTIHRKIADGGMAEIFLATQHGAEGFERPVVLKRILAALVADPQFRNMMIDEAHVAMGLHHSNIVQVLDLGQSKGRYFLVLEFVDGWDLNQLITRVRNATFVLPPELALYVTAEVCRALFYAHAKTRGGKALGIVHRDVSPHNVLVSEQGEVKLTDFGIAKAFGRREHTGAGVIKGKLNFMSPEQASGSVLDARSDLFSVGTMLYLMTTGRRPFEAPTDLEAILRVRQCDFPPPDQVSPHISGKLAAVIMRAMHLDPSARYQTAEEMLIDIESVQRTVFQPAGQTELKRWLWDLQAKDGVPPISRAPSPPPPTTETETFDLLDGEDLIFDDSRLVDPKMPELTVTSGPPVNMTLPLNTTMPPLPAAAPPTPVPPARRSRLGWVVVLAGAAAAGALYLAATREPSPMTGVAESPRALEPVAVPTPAPPAVLTPAAPVPLADAALAAAQPDAALAATPAADHPDATTAAPPPADSIELEPAGSEASQEDEEELLRRTEPDVEQKVIGEESAPAAPRKSAQSTAKAPAPESAVVSVRIATRPEGAVIRLKDRVFGRAPMNLRFRSGIIYELSFVKSGYATVNRRVAVSRRKNQAITVTLSKKPQKKRSLLKRLFGR